MELTKLSDRELLVLQHQQNVVYQNTGNNLKLISAELAKRVQETLAEKQPSLKSIE